MSTGKDPKSMPGTAEFRDGFDRIYGDKPPQRGRWVFDERQKRLVPADEYHPQPRAPLVSDAFMDGTVSQDGVDIGSKRKREEYKRQNRCADASDCSPEFYAKRRAEKERQATELTRRTVAELANVDTRNLPKAIDELRRKR